MGRMKEKAGAVEKGKQAEVKRGHELGARKRGGRPRKIEQNEGDRMKEDMLISLFPPPGGEKKRRVNIETSKKKKENGLGEGRGKETGDFTQPKVSE